VTNFLYVVIYKRSDRAALGPFLPTLVFISAITKVPHAVHTESHVYAVIEQTILVQMCYRHSTTVHVYAISVMVPWFDSIAYNAMMCSLPRFYGNEGMQPNNEAYLRFPTSNQHNNDYASG
jgi:hypothetical protein